jgi:hypothetical protein
MLRNNCGTMTVSILGKDKRDIEPYHTGSILKHSQIFAQACL